jgi:Carboxypeptidase regulatory-like domain
MTNGLQKYLTVLLVVAVSSLTAFAQGGSTGSISGTVMDQKGAVVQGANVVVKNTATNQEYSTTTSGDGTFSVPTLTAGVYTASITASGFKQALVTEIKVDVGKPSSVNVELEIGSANETVTVVGGGELLQTQSATIGTTLTGRQITDLPTVSRDALDLVLALPGTTTVGRPRTSSVNGLPKGALNISLDGVNVQDNLLKSSDGFFTYIRPRTDAISEVTVSTTTPGSESSSEGAVQIKFVTQGGSNDYHGGVYWYHRNPALNANYWFSNRDSAPDPVTKKAPQARILLNQPGGKIGGPISIPGLFSGKDKAFFFVNYEEYRLPEKTFRTRTILSPQAQSGIFRFNASAAFAPPAGTTCAPQGTGQLCSTNVFNLAQNAGLQFANTDPTIGALLSEIRSATSGFTITQLGDPNLQQVSFNNIGGQTRRFPTVRLDFNIMKKHHIENIWNYQQFGGIVDFLNGVDPAFPGFPNHGAQTSLRFSNVTAWRWTMTQNMVNEARFGLTGGSVLFFPEVNAGQFTNQSGFNLGIGQAGITSATVTTGPQRRNTPVKQFSDTLSWVNGNHSWNFGFNYTRVNFWQQLKTVVPSAAFVPSSTLDPAGFNAFSSLAGAGQQGGAANLYAVLSGRLSAVNANARLDEESLKYTFLGSLISRAQSSEMGFYVQDSWRVRPNITLSLGLRLERAIPYESRNDTYAFNTYESLFGESGVNNFLPNCANPATCTPGASAAAHSQFTAFPTGSRPYNQEFGTLLPSFGLVYSPNFRAGFLNRLMGQSGQTVIRLGFSMASVREGMNVYQAVTGSNPGGTITTNRNITLGNLAPGTYLRQGPFAPPSFPSALTFPNTGLLTDNVNGWIPDLKTGYVESWTIGIQRELDSNNVIEVRYIGNRGHRLWRQYDFNAQLNVRNNGLLQEFSLAQANLLANIAAGRGAQFRYQGPNTGTFPLPILFGYQQSQSPANAANCNSVATCNTLYSSTNFASTTYLATLNPLNPSVLGLAGLLSSTTFDNRRTPLGQACFGLTNCTGLGLFPYNMFLINPGKRGGSFIVDNGGQTYYDSVTVEFRRRLTRGLLVQSSYTFGKALSNTYASSSSVFDQPSDLFNPKIKKTVAPFNITHGFKANFIYELPFGQGRTWLSGISGWTEKLLGGWGVNGNIRVQSGSPFNLGNVQLVGMDRKELQDAVSIRRDVDADGVYRGNVYIFPLDIRVNTWKANNIGFNTSGSAIGGTFTQGAPTGRFIAPAGWGNCKQAHSGGCGFTNLVLYGPSFFRSDLSLVKRVKFSERTNLELRGEFLNAFNNINFLVGNASNDVNALGGLNATTFSRYTAAYQDLSTTNDPGGRLVQLVVRFNF